MARTKKKRDIELDAHGRAARDSEGSQNQQGDTPDFVKLTDISDIVSKYAVVDKLFTDEEQNDDEKPGAQAPDTVEAHSEQVIDKDEIEAEEDDEVVAEADTHVPERVAAKAEPVPEPEEAFEEEDEDEDVFESPAPNEALEAVAEPADQAVEEFDDEEFDDTGDTGAQRETEESVTRARAHVALLREAREARAEARRHGGHRTAAKRS
ncbi:MAG: hypothetical protein ACR2PM_07505, partial [Hyphomicrobiales bacterium]